MKRCLLLAAVFLLLNVSFGYAACTHAANDNCANAIALTVNATAVAGVTCGTLETGELVDCAPTGTNQSVWYSFVATATNMAVSVVSTGTCYVSSAVWPASSGCPASIGCVALSCQSSENGPATTVHDLGNLTVGATYEIQILYATGGGCGGDGSFTVQVTTAIPANPSNPLPISTCAVPSGPACMFNYNPTVAEVTAACTQYLNPGDDSSANNVVKSCFTFTGEYSTDISFSTILYSTCGTGNVTWFDWQLFDTTCTQISCGNLNSLTYSGILCGHNYTLCYAWEIPDCDESGFYPYIVAIPPTFTGTSTPGTSTTGTTLAVSICQGASVTLSGSATGYVSYVWSPAAGLSATTGASVTANPDTTTTYTLTGYDAGGCSQSKTIVVTVKPAPTASIVPAADTLTCTNTSLTLTASGGGTYAWSTGGLTTTSISATTPNTYTVTVTGANACSATATAIVSQNITPPPASINPPSPVLSCGVGSVNLTATGGGTYAWNTGGFTTPLITVTTANTYIVTVTGANGCTATASDVVTSSSSGITATATSTNATCVPNGTATVTPGGGSGYTYMWSNDSTTQTISNLSAGTYTVTVTGGGCTATASTLVTLSSSGVSASATSTGAGCTPNGTATVNPSGGSGYTYMWSNDSITQTISNLSAGTYTVTVTSSGCTATATTTVASNGGALTLTPGSTPASCGSTNGSATVNPSGGSGYTYIWSNTLTTQTISNVAGGTYVVTVTGTGGCSATASINVSTTGALSIVPATTATTCGNNNGSATVNTTGGTGTYTYVWSNTATTQTINNVASGTYTVIVTSGIGCSGTATVSVAPSTGLTFTTTATGTSCGNNNGSASIGVTGGSGNYTYQWSNSGSSSGINNLPSGTYQVTVNDGSGCSGTASVTINPSGDSSVVITPSSQTVCSGDTATICAPAGYASYSWSTGETTVCISTTATGNYYVTATDNGGCTATSNHVSIANFTPTPVTLSVSGDTLTSYGAVSYQWYLNGQPISGATTSTIIATQSGSYTVEITDNNGCHYSSSPTIVKLTGINDINAQNAIKVYPNPLSAGNWHVDVSDALIGSTCEVFDADGRMVYKDELRSTQSEISLNVAQGVYMLQIHSAQVNYNVKLIKLY